MALLQYSTTNIANSLAEPVATELLAQGYLLYWKAADCLQTQAGWYPEYFQQQDTIMRRSDVQAAFLASKGILTISNGDFSIPQLPTRPTSDGYISYIEDVPVPIVTLDVQHLTNGELVELGAKTKVRYASFLAFGLARDYPEQQWLMERLRTAFDSDQTLLVLDHDAGTKAEVGPVEIVSSDVSTDIYPTNVDAMAFEFTLNARLRYEA